MTSRIREMSGRWFFKQEWGFQSAPNKVDFEAFGKALIHCAGADGELAPEEREWILGYLASHGAEESTIEMLSTYKADQSIHEVLAPSSIAQGGRRAFVYDALRACSADGELHDLERAAVTKLATDLGLPEGTVPQLEAAYRAESEAKARRIALIFPGKLPF
ncbi:MAG: DUF533 domain-containing protein [Polyangiaceae bacterium]